MHLKVMIFMILLTFARGSLYADSPFELKRSTDGSILSAGMSGLILGTYLNYHIKTLTVDDIVHLSRERIPKFDRRASYNWSPSASRASDYLLVACALLPLSLISSEKIRDDYQTISVLYAETLLLTNALGSLCKVTAKRIRPYAYHEAVPLKEKLQRDTRRSFYSLHTASAFASAAFYSGLYSRYHPDSRWKTTVWAASLTGASVIGYLRIRAGKHFPSDVLAGACMGTLTGYLIPKLHFKKQVKSDTRFSFQFRWHFEDSWI